MHYHELSNKQAAAKVEPARASGLAGVTAAKLRKSSEEKGR